MSRKQKAEEFKLNDSDAEDYLDFMQAQADADDSKVSRSSVSKKGSTRSQSTKVSEKRQAIEQSVSREDDYKPSVDDQAESSKRIPLKSVLEHQQLMNQLNTFAASARFGPILKNCDIAVTHLRKKTVAELRELRERVRACCANAGGNGGIVCAVAIGACGRAEAWAPKSFMDLDGFQAEIEKNPEFASLCEMIEIDSGFASSMSPMQRLVMCLGTTALSVAAMNKAKSAVKGANAALVASLQAQQQALPKQPESTKPASNEGPIREY